MNIFTFRSEWKIAVLSGDLKGCWFSEYIKSNIRRIKIFWETIKKNKKK